MTMQATATLAKLDLASTTLCAHCAALLFGQVAFCPYCGEDGTRSGDSASRLAPRRAEFPSEFPSGFESGSGSESPELRRPAPQDLAPEGVEAETVAWARPAALPGPAVPATATGWSTGRTTALAVCVAALALGAIQFFKTDVSVPRVASKTPAAPRSEAQVEPRPHALAVAPTPPTPTTTTPLTPRIAEPGNIDCSDALAALALCGKGLMPEPDASRVSSR